MKTIQRISILILMLSMLGLNTPVNANLINNETLPVEAPGDVGAPPAHSTTGPVPPVEVVLHDLLKGADEDFGVMELEGVVLNVPAYFWRHGCGPTALSMVVGYYDSKGFGNLIAGDAWTQTAAVSQMIASGRDGDATLPVDFKGHYEDYAVPMESLASDSSPLEPDDYITAGRVAHADNSLADYIGTSRSTSNLKYGWSDIVTFGSTFVDYFHRAYPGVEVGWKSYYMSQNTMTWNVLVREIDAGRPMVFLVDSRADGQTDHFVTVIGYRVNPDTHQQQYASHDTWGNYVRWENFSPMAAGTPFGIYGGWAYQVSHPPTDIGLSNSWVAEQLPIGTPVGSFSTSDVLIGDLFSYTLVPGSGDADNAAFSISGNKLVSNVVFDFKSRTEYSIRVRSTDSNGDWVEESFGVQILEGGIQFLYLPMVGR